MTALQAALAIAAAVLQPLGLVLLAILVLVLQQMIFRLQRRVRALEQSETTITLHGVDPSQVTVTPGSPPTPPSH